MKFISGQDRNQTHLFPISLDQSIGSDNEVRLIDLFVDSLILQDYGFKTEFIENGRPAYHPTDLLKLFIYGYLNKTRSSRDLEKACKINIEVMWLLKTLQPDHNTISNFRRDNPKAIKKVFRTTLKIAKHFNLIGGKLIAGDSTKFRAQNSKKNNFNSKKIERHIAYIDQKIEEHTKDLALADKDRKVQQSQQIKKEIEKHRGRKATYKQIKKQIAQTGEKQVSTSDPDSRQMITRNNITEVAYNVQTTVDAKYHIPIDFKVTNTTDSKAMGDMLQRAKAILGGNNFTALYDKGYHTGSEFKKAYDLEIDVMVAIPKVASQAPTPEYNVEHFVYNQEGDYYVCPQGSKLTTKGTWHKACNYKFKRYTTKDCITCKAKALCTKAKYGKGVQRSEYQVFTNQNKERIEENKNYYRQRQSIVEHPYGTIKRQWGFSYIMTKKGMERASADVGLIFTAYNFRRLINILGKEVLINYLRILVFSFFTRIGHVRAKISRFNASELYSKIIKCFIQPPPNRLKFT